jgi:AraC-like DNA-binding protein
MSGNIMKKSFTNSKVQRNIIVSYVITGLILTGILSLTYSYILTNQIINSRYNQADSALQVATSSTTLLLEEVYARYFQLFQTDPQLVQYKNDQSDITLQSYLGNLAFNDVLVDSIVLVDMQNQSIVDSLSRNTSLEDAEDPGINEMLTDLTFPNSAIRNLIFFPRMTIINQQEKKYLTLTFASRTEDGILNKVMFVNIDARILSELLYHESNTSYMIIINRNGQIIADSSHQYFNDYYFSLESDVSKNIGIDVENAYVADIANIRSIVAYMQTSRFNLTFFSINDYQQITSEVFKSNWIVMMLFGFFLALTGVLSLVLSKKIYMPIQRLVRQIAQMNDLNPDFQVDEFEFIYKALEDINQRKMSDELRGVFAGKKAENTDIDWSDVQIIVLQPRLVNVNRNQDLKTSEHIWELFKPHITLIDEYSLSAIATAEQIEKYVQYNSDTWIAGISHKVEKPDQINKCFRQAKVACEFAFTKEEVRVQYYSDIISHDTTNARLQIKNQLHTYIIENYHDSQMSIESLAFALGYSIGYVRQIFKEEMGIPYNEYLIQVRIEEAKRLLEETDLSAKEIGDKVGISDTRYFYTLFKNRMGMTAQEYRKSQRESKGVSSEL